MVVQEKVFYIGVVMSKAVTLFMYLLRLEIRWRQKFNNSCIIACIVFTWQVDANAATAIPQEVKKSVAFIYVKDGKDELVPNGTAFFVEIPNAADKDQFFGYLVTAKHVLTASDDAPWLPSVFLRLDKLEGGTETIELRLITEGPGKTVYTHSDPTVDIAVIPFVPNQTKFDFIPLSAELITSREDFPELGISEGTEVFFSGLFTPYMGKKKNYPVVRFGRVALLTDEKVDWNGVLLDLYLVESASYDGNSGSPVFIYLGVDRKPGSLIVGKPDIRLAGVMKGAFQENQPTKSLETSNDSVNFANIGIAAVVPAYQLREILFSEELKKMRSYLSYPFNYDRFFFEMKR